VTVVGAGAAGLYAAHLLYQQGVEVEILEAATQPGGRIRSLQSFAGFPIELGAEELHGANSTWYQLIQQTGFSLTKDETTDYYYYKNSLQKLSDIATQPDIKSTLDFVKNLPNYTGADVKLQDLIACLNRQ
jgi:protoporphyrinogen oxidase